MVPETLRRKKGKRFWTVLKPDHPEIKLPIGSTSCPLPQIEESNSGWNSNQNWGSFTGYMREFTGKCKRITERSEISKQSESSLLRQSNTQAETARRNLN